MTTNQQLKELCAEISTMPTEEEDFHLKILVYLIATELMYGKPSDYRGRLEETLEFLLPRTKDPSLWPDITLCPVSTLWSLFDMDNRTKFFLVAKVTIGDVTCEIVFRQELKRKGFYRAMYFIDFLGHRNKTKCFRKEFTKEEILMIRTPLEQMKGMKDQFFNATNRTVFQAEASNGESGFVQLQALYETLDTIAHNIRRHREEAAYKDPVKARELRKQRFIQSLQES